jgi:hypothetical protein
MGSMRGAIRKFFRHVALMILPDSDRLRFLAYKPRFEAWRKKLIGKHPVFVERTEMYDFINSEIIGNRPMVYLEFGVFKGASIKYFAEIHKNKESRFVGFDTFEGLPEDWTDFSRPLSSKTFSTEGKPPVTDDGRISFVKGLFQETLPSFLKKYSPSEQLVIHNDSDLYSATMYVLSRANDIIVPGTIIIFDEFYSALHEFRAFEDYCSSYMRKYEVIAAQEGHGKVAVRML